MYKEMLDLHGKVALVTGASKGIGQSIALALGEAGANVSVLGRNVTDLQKTVEGIQQYSVKALPILADVTKREDISCAVSVTLKEFQTIDILVNNAGMSIVKPTIDYTLEEWNQVLSTNLTSVFLFCKEVAPIMMEKKAGKIINISSIAGLNGGPGVYIAYSASKGGLIALTKALATEWGRYKINVNCIAPGSFYTDMSKGAHDNEEIHQKYLKKIPLKRIGQPSEIGPLAVYLASEASNFMTGETIVIDGGMILK